MKVFLDTNILQAEAFGESPLFRFFLFASHSIGYTVSVPPFVLDEIVSKFGKQLTTDLNKAKRTAGTLSKRLSRDMAPALSEVIVNDEVESFGIRLLSLLQTGRFELLPYPDTSHKKLVRKAVRRKRPFDDSGSGYRDALIWELMLDALASNDEDIILISGDKDFLDGTDIHPDLLGEIPPGLLSRQDNLALFTTLSSFVESHVSSHLELVLQDDAIDALQYLGVDAGDTIGLAVQETYRHYWDNNELELPDDFESLELGYVLDVYDYAVGEVRKVEMDRVLLTGSATLLCEFETFVHKSAAYDLEHLTIYDHDWNSHYVHGAVTVELACDFHLDVNLAEPKKPDVSVLILEARRLSASPPDG